MKKTKDITKRILLCSNDLTQSIKEHNLVEHKLFYDMYYYWRMEELKGEDTEGIHYLDLYDIKKIIGDRYSKQEIFEIINKLPREIKVKGSNQGFISIYEYVVMFEEGMIEYKYTDTFIQFADYEIPVKKPHTALDLNEMKQLNRTYSQKLYELYKQYSGNMGAKGQNNYNMPISYFYEFFNIRASNRVSEVLRFGIDQAIKELHETLGISIAYEKVKKGKSITHIHFYFI